MKKRKGLLLGIAAAMLLLCSSCTSAFTNASTYFSNTGDIMSVLFQGDSAKAPGETHSGSGAALDAPEGFSVDAGGNYTFNGVEGADYYLLYFCAPTATEDGDDFLYSSENIPAKAGTGAYSGNVNDLIDYAYGTYLVKVFAFPELGDAEHAMSSAATAEYTVSGAMEAPQIAYFWNTFENTMELQLTNVGNYTYQAYPDKVEVTFTNVADSADQVVVSMDAPTPENNAVSSTQLARGVTYDISAVAFSGSEHVTNQTTDATTVGKGVTVGEINVITDDFYYTDNIKGELVYPRVRLGFDLASGGSVGDTIGTYGACRLNATPAQAASGSSYTYDIYIEMDVWNNMVWTMSGALELYEDGTLLLREFGMQGPVPPSSIAGFWVDNNDGTATLCYDPSTVTVG